MIVYRRREGERNAEAVIITGNGPPPAKARGEEGKRCVRGHFVMPDGTPIFDRGTLMENSEIYAETLESYRGYLR